MTPPLEFGVFPRGLAGAPGWVARGRRDDPAAIARALADLRGDGPPLLPRGYVNWSGRWLNKAALAQVRRIAQTPGPPSDLALCYRDKSGDVTAWTRFVTRVVSDYGHRLAAVQVTGEANLTGIPGGVDGAFPRAAEALVRGVLSAAEAKRVTGATAAIGFAAAVEAAPDPAGFWAGVRDLGGAEFAAALDYAGIDVYIDVFGPRVGVDKVAEAVAWVLRTFRERTLPIAGVPASTPIRICENGWPTGPDRSEATQARVLEATLRAVHELRAELNVTHWELFTLRDANSSKDDMFYRFGVLRDDYSAKPAFGMLRDLMAELRRG
ncbi:MAG TPA: hypothetical protein VH589_12205 [Trebonia sp.]